jgi:hypothetical protein
MIPVPEAKPIALPNPLGACPLIPVSDLLSNIEIPSLKKLAAPLVFRAAPS